MRRLLFLVALLLVGTPALADDLDRILKEGAVRAGICLSAEPIGYRDGENVPRGYDVDVAGLMAEALGVRLDLVEVSVATRISDLIEGRIDVVVCNLTATVERARSIDFSFPYLRTGIKLLVPVGSALTRLDDVNASTRIVVHRGTTGEDLVRARGPEAELIYAETPGDALLLIRLGEADGYVEDSLVVDTLARENPEQVLSLPATYTMDAVAFGIRKGNPGFLRWLDIFASTYVSSGRYAETYGRWWGEPPPPIIPMW